MKITTKCKEKGFWDIVADGKKVGVIYRELFLTLSLPSYFVRGKWVAERLDGTQICKAARLKTCQDIAKHYDWRGL